jgi:hypothetical protein
MTERRNPSNCISPNTNFLGVGDHAALRSLALAIQLAGGRELILHWVNHRTFNLLWG